MFARYFVLWKGTSVGGAVSSEMEGHGVDGFTEATDDKPSPRLSDGLPRLLCNQFANHLPQLGALIAELRNLCHGGLVIGSERLEFALYLDMGGWRGWTYGVDAFPSEAAKKETGGLPCRTYGCDFDSRYGADAAGRHGGWRGRRRIAGTL